MSLFWGNIVIYPCFFHVSLSTEEERPKPKYVLHFFSPTVWLQLFFPQSTVSYSSNLIMIFQLVSQNVSCFFLQTNGASTRTSKDSWRGEGGFWCKLWQKTKLYPFPDKNAAKIIRKPQVTKLWLERSQLCLDKQTVGIMLASITASDLGNWTSSYLFYKALDCFVLPIFYIFCIIQLTLHYSTRTSIENVWRRTYWSCILWSTSTSSRGRRMRRNLSVSRSELYVLLARSV